MNYTTVRVLIESGSIRHISQILDHIPAADIASGMDMPVDEITNLLMDAGQLNVAHIHQLSELLNVDTYIVLALAGNQFLDTRE